MNDYIIINGVNSNTISGLKISKLPPITKPQMRTLIEAIDGRDGDLITDLGYSSYDKQLEIGLWGTYDINEIISFFNQEGTITFSNEADKFYNFKIINQIDYQKLLKFKTAVVVMHCQPFKYPTSETPIEIAYQYVNNEAEEMALDNTADAPMNIDLKGNTYQYSTTGKNLLDISDITNITGVTRNEDKITLNGQPNSTNWSLTTPITLKANRTYTLSLTNKINATDSAIEYSSFILRNGSTNIIRIFFNAEQVSYTPTEDTIVNVIRIFRGDTYTFSNYTFSVQLEESSTATSYEPYTNGASPNPDYPQDIQVVSGDNTINICGKTLLKLDFVTERPTFAGLTFTHTDSSFTLKGTATGTWTIFNLKNYPPIQNGETYTFKANVTGTNPAMKISIYLWNEAGKQIGNFIIDKNNNYELTKTINFFGEGELVLNSATFVIEGLTSGSNYDLSANIMLEKGNAAPTSYEPYQGVNYPINLGVKNLWENQLTGFLPQSGSYPTTSSSYPNARYVLINLLAGQSITLSGSTSTVGRVRYIDKDTNQVIGMINKGETEYYKSSAFYTGQFDEGTITAKKEVIIGIMDMSGIVNNLVVNYGTTPQTISETPIELCKIGDYQDYIYKDSGKWYVEKQIGKVVLNGSESGWSKQNLSFQLIDNNADINKIASVSVGSFSENYKFEYWSSGISEKLSNYAFGWNSTKIFTIRNDNYSTIGEFTTYLGTNNQTFYIPLATPTYTEITDSTLIEQLNNLANVRSYDTSTHITQNANDKPFILNATALQKGSDTGVVNNIGNIYSKPTIDIEGTGTIGVYLEGNQMFNVDLSNSNEIIIDTTNLEAYDPTTNALMNRQVTGDYSNFKLNVGNNNVKVTGNVTKATITNYVRWL